MSTLPGLLKRCIAKLWLVGIVLLILIALFVSAVRTALPYLNEYQSQVSRYLLENHQINVSMASVTGEWKNGGPTLTFIKPKFNNVELLGVDFSAQKLALQLNVPQSIMALEPRFNWIEVNQAAVLLGEFNTTDNQFVDDPIPALFSLVKTINFDDLVVSFSPGYGELPPVHVSKLRWLAGEEQHQIQLKLAAEKTSEAPLSILINLFGESKKSLSGNAYVDVVDWQWTNDLSFVVSPLLSAQASGQASFRLWLDFSFNSVESMLIALGENELDWVSENQKKQLSVVPHNMQWQSNAQGWSVAIEQLQLLVNQQALLPIDIFVDRINGEISGGISQLDIAATAPLSGLISALTDENKQLITKLSPVGVIAPLAFSQSGKQWQYYGEITGYGHNQVGGIPLIKDLGASFQGIDTHGSATLSFNQQSLDFGRYFKQSIAIASLESQLYWGADESRTWLGVTDLSLSNDDLSSQLALQVVFEPEQSPVLSLYGEMQVATAKHIDNYLPHVVLSDGLVNYLGQAIQAGASEDVSLLWQGAVNKFPYNERDGTFEANANVHDASYQFHPDWLAFTDASVNLNFRNTAMVITGQSGKLKQLEFESLVTRIDNLLEDPRVIVDVTLEQPQSKINDFVFGSILDDSVGSVLRQLDVKGNVRTTLNIDIPLDGSVPIITGEVALNENDVTIKSIDLSVEQVSGKLAIINGDVVANNMSGMLYQQPIKFDLETKPLDSDYYGIELDLSAQWHSDKIPQSWHEHLDDYLTGSIDWQGRITLKISEDDVSYQANFKSPMRGLELKLPKPLDKYVDQQENLRISTVGNTNTGQFNLALGSRAEVLADFSTAGGSIKLSQMSLLVGRGFNAQDVIARDGSSIKIDLASLEVDEWKSFIDSIEQGQSEGDFFPPLKRIEATVDSLTILNQQLSDVVLMSSRTPQGWHINVESEQASGHLIMFDDLTQGIKAQFNRLVLNSDAPSEVKGDAASLTMKQLTSLPLLDFSCVSCQIEGVEIGQLSFITKLHPQGIEIANITVGEANTSLTANAIWGFDKEGEFTQLNGALNSKKLEQTLQLFGFSSGINDSGLKSDFEFKWRGSFYDPQIATLNGEMSWNISEGHISEVSDKGVRIFSLFSLDSLRRKLALDFRDVFVKGIFYNDFKGTFAIENGVAVTHDAYMDGIAGGIDVVGSINLATQELDYYVTFSPNLFSNIPVIAGVVTSTPQVFVLAFALTKVLEPIIDVISQVNFKLSGSVDNPQFVEINRKQKKYKVPAHILPTEPTSVVTDHAKVDAIQGAKID